MTNYKLLVAYDGTKYIGFQKQSKHPEKTIQGKLENVLSKLFNEEIQIIGSGRTDAGVHAKAQTCNFHVQNALPIETILEYLKTYLPEDLSIVQLSLCSDRFHSRYNAIGKCYSYTIDTSFFRDPFSVRYSYHIDEALDLDKMREASQYLIGQHDFRAFTSLKSKTKSTIKTIHSITFTEKDQKLIITYEGNGFLQHMVRIITGTLIEIGLGKREVSSILELLESKERSKAGFKAPSEGLCLEKVFY